MFFCEKCNLLSSQDICQNCNKKTRKVCDDDYCYLIDLHLFKAKMLETMLTNNNLEFVVLPTRNDLAGHSAFSKEADTHRIFVKYKNYQTAIDIYNDFIR